MTRPDSQRTWITLRVENLGAEPRCERGQVMKEASRKTKYVGLDVHAASIVVVVANAGRKGEVRSYGRIDSRPESLKKVLKKLGAGKDLHVCYEAGPCGYGIYWQLTELGIKCEVVAPTLIPKKSGERVKTDRRDAEKLARCLRSGELTAVWVPDKGHEALRELVRARHVAVTDCRRARQRLGHFLLRQGRPYPMKTKKWGSAHMQWLRAQRFEHGALTETYSDLLYQVQHQSERIERIEKAIDGAVAGAPAHMQALIASLQALRGVAKTTATTVAVELGDLGRFRHPEQLMAYLGLTCREHSSGGSMRRGSITKTGNRIVRTALVEAAWSYRFRPARSPALRKRQKELSPEVLAIAWKAQHRLCGRYRYLCDNGKRSVIAATAVARELAGFVWDIGQQLEGSTNMPNTN